MSYFVILARKNWGEQCAPLTQVRGVQERAINVAMKVFKDGGMNRVVVVDDTFKIVFKQDRKCKCVNAQYRTNGLLQCDDCNRVIETAKYKVEEYQ